MRQYTARCCSLSANVIYSSLAARKIFRYTSRIVARPNSREAVYGVTTISPAVSRCARALESSSAQILTRPRNFALLNPWISPARSSSSLRSLLFALEIFDVADREIFLFRALPGLKPSSSEILFGSLERRSGPLNTKRRENLRRVKLYAFTKDSTPCLCLCRCVFSERNGERESARVFVMRPSYLLYTDGTDKSLTLS